ncbi:MAG TPA: RNA-guided pseudouridylation complex pseudouridine synthase subunit Cbf5 [Candidatus Lokiarchaeia archaeon]|nr:RNA-guided pseudouridylation complex pseudouridine synthase subunit Cbf5 [Candidatus Lokiarchaeia archaeon]
MKNDSIANSVPQHDVKQSMNLLVKDEDAQISNIPSVFVQQSLEGMLQAALIILDKPDGYVCHDIASMVKEMLAGTGVTKVGHGGTLDPNATGVLPLALNRATIIQDVLLSGTKEYVCVMHLHGDPGDETLQGVVRSFIGEVQQVPPDRSAVKRAPRMRRIESLEILERNERDVLLKIACDAGTYIRTLCVDIGNALGCGAHLTELRRTRSGSFSESNTPLMIAQDIDAGARAWLDQDDASLLKGLLQPVERALDDYPRLVIADRAIKSALRGNGIKANDVVAINAAIQEGSKIAIFTIAGEIIARGRSMMSASAILETRAGFIARISKIYADSSLLARYR